MALTISSDNRVTELDWKHIETVLLDMDGTLLDLKFDNHFWLHTVPEAYAAQQGLSPDEAKQQLHDVFAREVGTLNWYCLDFWSETLGLDIVSIKQQAAHGIGWRQEGLEFLQRLHRSHCQVILITNAHPETLRIKLECVDLAPWFDHLISSHQYATPKETQKFWQLLQTDYPFDRAKTLFIDDSEHVLQAAEQYGVGHLITLRQPDSTIAEREQTHYPAILHFDEIYSGL